MILVSFSWLGFELFELRVQVHSYWVQFYAHAQWI